MTADAWSPGRSGPLPSARSPRVAVRRPAGGRYVRSGASAGSREPAGRSWHASRGRAASRGARWNSPRSAPEARTGGPWDWRRPAAPTCSAANFRPLSASQTRQQALAGTDHLAILHAVWTDQTTSARGQHYRDLLLTHLPPEHRREPSHQAQWLWRTLRAAELAGLDPGDVLATAIGERDLGGARDLAAVIDARIRHRLGTPSYCTCMTPIPSRPPGHRHGSGTSSVRSAPRLGRPD
jgi:hypothetical protein